MRRIIIGFLAALCATSAWGQSLNLSAAERVPEKVISLDAVHAVMMRIPNCSVTLPDTWGQCEAAIEAFTTPIVLREVQVHPSPGATAPGVAAQCWARVFVSVDRVAFKEIGKFSWSNEGYRGFNHVLPVPIALRPTDQAVMRLMIGIVSTATEGVECRAEAKVYNTTH